MAVRVIRIFLSDDAVGLPEESCVRPGVPRLRSSMSQPAAGTWSWGRYESLARGAAGSFRACDTLCPVSRVAKASCCFKFRK
jgi:hypothetical protein